MPSPFPGMDPYLEGDLWTTIHATLTAEMSRQLTPKLRGRYVALISKRFVLETTEDDSLETTNLYPDIAVVEEPSERLATSQSSRAAAPLLLATAMPSEVPHFRLEIRDVTKRRWLTLQTDFHSSSVNTAAQGSSGHARPTMVKNRIRQATIR